MAGLKPKDIRAMSPEEKLAKLNEIKEELMHERGVASMGGAPMSPGKIRALRKNVARVLTIIGEETRAKALKASKKAPKPAKVRSDKADEKAEPKKVVKKPKSEKKGGKATKAPKKK